MPKTTRHATHRVAYEGAVDADGHILEPPELWETYLEPKYRDRALRINLDENGLEELEIGGTRSVMSRALTTASVLVVCSSDRTGIHPFPLHAAFPVGLGLPRPRRCWSARLTGRGCSPPTLMRAPSAVPSTPPAATPASPATTPSRCRCAAQAGRVLQPCFVAANDLRYSIQRRM